MLKAMTLTLKSAAAYALVASIAMLACAASAQELQVEHTPIPRDPRPNFGSLSFLVGTWNCQVASSRRPRPFTSRATTFMSPDGYWLITRTITDKVPWNPITITNTEYVTYDPTTQRWIDLSLDNY